MSFLFASLPTSNFEMNDRELRLWERASIFECECDNFINSRIEEGPNYLRRPLVEQTGVTEAIRRYGLLPRANFIDNNGAEEINHFYPPPARRARLMIDITDRDCIPLATNLDQFYQRALIETIRQRGLGINENP